MWFKKINALPLNFLSYTIFFTLTVFHFSSASFAKYLSHIYPKLQEIVNLFSIISNNLSFLLFFLKYTLSLPQKLCSPAPFWTGCSPSLLSSCHTGHFFYHYPGIYPCLFMLDPLFPKSQVLLFLVPFFHEECFLRLWESIFRCQLFHFLCDWKHLQSHIGSLVKYTASGWK